MCHVKNPPLLHKATLQHCLQHDHHAIGCKRRHARDASSNNTSQHYDAECCCAQQHTPRTHTTTHLTFHASTASTFHHGCVEVVEVWHISQVQLLAAASPSMHSTPHTKHRHQHQQHNWQKTLPYFCCRCTCTKHRHTVQHSCNSWCGEILLVASEGQLDPRY